MYPLKALSPHHSSLCVSSLVLGCIFFEEATQKNLYIPTYQATLVLKWFIYWDVRKTSVLVSYFWGSSNNNKKCAGLELHNHSPITVRPKVLKGSHSTNEKVMVSCAIELCLNNLWSLMFCWFSLFSSHNCIRCINVPHRGLLLVKWKQIGESHFSLCIASAGDGEGGWYH